MIVATAEIRLYAPWVHSLKEKRMTVKSILAKVHNQFQVAVAETAENDMHQTIVIGLACVAGNTAQADSVLEHVLNFIEENTEAEITDIRREIR